jgi:dipeptidyl aminopeptidase/acylaminoacyl peptidase
MRSIELSRRTLLRGAAGAALAAVSGPMLPVAADDDVPYGPIARYMDSIWHRPQNGGEFTIRSRYRGLGSDVDPYVIAYRSDNLTITGLMIVPVGQGDGPWPTLLINHGHFAFNEYDTGYDTLREDIFFAQNGYLTIATDYRNYAGSDKGEYQLEPGYTYDVRNLLDAIRFVAPVDARRVGMMGHSMGGGITQQVLVTTQGQVKAATLYGSVSGDEVDNYNARHGLWRSQASPTATPEGDKVTDQYGPPDAIPEAYRRMSPINYLDRIDCPVAIHHSVSDPICPYSWAEKLRDAFSAKGKPVEFHGYQGQPHSFQGAGFQEYLQANLAYFDKYVKNG